MHPSLAYLQPHSRVEPEHSDFRMVPTGALFEIGDQLQAPDGTFHAVPLEYVGSRIHSASVRRLERKPARF